MLISNLKVLITLIKMDWWALLMYNLTWRTQWISLVCSIKYALLSIMKMSKIPSKRFVVSHQTLVLVISVIKFRIKYVILQFMTNQTKVIPSIWNKELIRTVSN